MFDDLPFLTFELSDALTDPSAPRFRQNLDDFQRDNRLYIDTDAIKAEYRNTGRLRLLPTPPVSDFAREHLIYPLSFHVLEADCNFYTRREGYNAWMLLMTIGGKGFLEYRGHSYTLLSGDCFMIDCRALHDYRAGPEGWHHAVLHFDGTPARALGDVFLQRASVKFAVDEATEEQLSALLELICSVQPYREVLVSASIYQLLTTLIVQTQRSPVRMAAPEVIRQLIAYMETNYAVPLSLDDLSRFSNISKYHLSREFRKYTGIPPHEYITRIRLKHGRLLLETTGYSIATIGSLVGIPDANNFHYLFKKRYGITPGQCRANNK